MFFCWRPIRPSVNALPPSHLTENHRFLLSASSPCSLPLSHPIPRPPSGNRHSWREARICDVNTLSAVSECQFNRSCVNRIKVMRSHKDDLPTLPNLPGFGTLQFFRSKLLFVLLSKIASSLLSFAPLIKEEGVKIPPLLHSRSYTSKWRFLVSK